MYSIYLFFLDYKNQLPVAPSGYPVDLDTVIICEININKIILLSLCSTVQYTVL